MECWSEPAASSALVPGGFFIDSTIFLSCCFTDWKKISRLNRPEPQNKYGQERRLSAASRSATSKQFSLITAHVLPLSLDNLPHRQPLPAFGLPHAPMGRLGKYKRQDQTLWLTIDSAAHQQLQQLEILQKEPIQTRFTATPHKRHDESAGGSEVVARASSHNWLQNFQTQDPFKPAC